MMSMETERPSPRYANIDLWEPAEILEAMIEGQFAAVAAVRAAHPAIESAGLAIERRLKRGGRLVYMGAGTSGRLAVQDGAELMPTFGWPQERLLLFMAGGKNALLQAVEGAEDQEAQAVELVRRHGIGPADAAIAVAASGTTPFTVACLRAAREAGALAVGVANNRDTPLLKESDHAIFLDTGPEAIAGSTRMKAGTAQRITLMLLSSLVMISLGRVYDGLMVDVQASNRKLVRRSERILSRLSGRGHEDVQEALGRAGGSVKLAFLLLQGYQADEAQTALDRADGHLRRAMSLIGEFHEDALEGTQASIAAGSSEPATHE
jgi:N-acetylmuramic acid 6-phosphate etherase